MSAPPVVVSFGDAPETSLHAALGGDVILARDASSPADLLQRARASERPVLWLPAWAQVSSALVDGIAAWRAADSGGAARVARVRVARSCGPRAAFGGETIVLLSSPGAVLLDGEAPRPAAGARIEELATALEIRLPEDLTQHLAGVNEQSTLAARLRHAAGREATWSDLSWRPVLHAVRALASASGARREALPHAVIEAYRGVLAAAKLWELAHGTALT